MSVLSYGEFTSQQSAIKVRPSKGASQFKGPLRFQSGVQSGQLLEQDQRYSTPGSTSSKGVSQFKGPLRFQSGVQSGQLPVQDRPYSASGAPLNRAPLFQVTNPSQPVIQQPGKRMEQSGYHSRSGMHLLNVALQHSGPTMSLPRVLAHPSIVARDTYSAGEPITQKSGILPFYPNKLSTDPYIGVPAPLSPLEALRQKRASQFLSASDRSWQPALPRTATRVRSGAQHTTKTHVAMKVILMGGTALLVGGIASFLLLRFPTYLAVAWAILIIVFSNLISRELRSYYRHTPTTLGMEAVHPSTISTDGMDMGRHPILKDITDTTGYLKALCLVFKDDHPVQTFPPERVYKV